MGGRSGTSALVPGHGCQRERGGPPYQVVDQTLDDNLDGFSETANHAPAVTIHSTSSWRYGGDGSRAEFPASQAAKMSHLARAQPAGGRDPRLLHGRVSHAHTGFLLSVNGTRWTWVSAQTFRLTRCREPPSWTAIAIFHDR